MHCVRRAALRAACSSTRVFAVPRQQIAAIAMPMSKTSVQPAGALLLPRYFSQTSPVAAEEGDDAAVNNATEAAQQNGFDTLESSLTEKEQSWKKGYTIFISNVTFDATETHLNEAFNKYGEILASNIGRDGRGLSRGFGFVTFAEKESMDRAVSEAHDSFWHGRRITVAPRKEQSGSPRGNNRERITGPTNSLYIGNIPYEASDADLNQLFRSLDKVKDVRVAIDRNTGWPRGFAHADFEDVESAQKAYDFLQEKTLSGRSLRIDFAQSRRND